MLLSTETDDPDEIAALIKAGWRNSASFGDLQTMSWWVDHNGWPPNPTANANGAARTCDPEALPHL
jgi:hypothetical protein